MVDLYLISLSEAHNNNIQQSLQSITVVFVLSSVILKLKSEHFQQSSTTKV